MDGSDQHWLTTEEGFRRRYPPGRIFGYCEDVACQSYLIAIFMWLHEGPFVCLDCRKRQGFLVSERGIRSGPTYAPYGEVRVEYNFDPTQERYRSTAVLRDNALGERIRTFTFQSPHVEDQQHAFKLAEGFLVALNDGIELALEDGTEIPRPMEHVVSFDLSREKFKERMQRLGWALKDNAFFQEPVDVFSLFSEGEGENYRLAEEIDIGSQ